MPIQHLWTGSGRAPRNPSHLTSSLPCAFPLFHNFLMVAFYTSCALWSNCTCWLQEQLFGRAESISILAWWRELPLMKRSLCPTHSTCWHCLQLVSASQPGWVLKQTTDDNRNGLGCGLENFWGLVLENRIIGEKAINVFEFAFEKESLKSWSKGDSGQAWSWRCDVLFRKCHSYSAGRVRQRGGGFLFVNQQVSPVAIVLRVIALQSCVPCMPCLVCSSLWQEEEKLGYYPKCCGFSWWHTSTQSTIAVQYPLPPVLILSSHICANTLLTAVCCQSAFLY